MGRKKKVKAWAVIDRLDKFEVAFSSKFEAEANSFCDDKVVPVEIRILK